MTNSYELDGTFILDIELPVIPHICPKCGETTKYIKDYRICTVKFGKVQRGPLIGKYRQRRYICPHCEHSFAESNPFVRKHMQLSVTNIKQLFDKITESLIYTAIAKECATSIITVLRYYSMITIPKPKTLPTVLGIDEFKGNAAGYQYQVNLTNPDAHEILDI
ncbi:transposase family protein, partial [Veillonella sp.]|uniref:transposase family protein n=1 Tax=Veillonella sp. TaxID=1926307 RepID=UPI00257F6D60